MDKYFLLEGCTMDDAGDFFESRLSHNIGDYPSGIVIPVDKPYRWTSADVVRKIKFQLQRHFGEKKLKVGHAGTLDPLATGLLTICVGKATKIAEELQSHRKEYVATIEFGATTPSYDLEQPVDAEYPWKHITKESVENALKGFLGEQDQVPPVFSAKIIGGLRAYEYARAGEEVELKTNHIEIFNIELLDFFYPDGDGKSEKPAGIATYNSEKSDLSAVRNIHNYHVSQSGSEGKRAAATIRVVCSKGTYIRSLARDLGLALESGAYLTALRRIASGDLRVKE